MYHKQRKNNLEAELEEYKLVRRPEVVERIKIARSYGDLSENSEYEAAKDEQALLKDKFRFLKQKFVMQKSLIVMLATFAGNDEVAIGKTVVVQEVGTNDKDTYHIVGAAGADIFSGKISNESPIAQALIGKKVGDKVAIESPAGSYSVEILMKNSLSDC